MPKQGPGTGPNVHSPSAWQDLYGKLPFNYNYCCEQYFSRWTGDIVFASSPGQLIYITTHTNQQERFMKVVDYLQKDPLVELFTICS